MAGVPSARLARRIQAAMSQLTASELRLARFCWENGTRLAFWPAAKCAKAVGVSESTVVRFARSLGYESYAELQADIWEEIQERLRRPIPQRLEGTKHEAPSGSQSYLLEALNQDMANLQETAQTCSEEEFQKAVELILQAKRVFVIGLRASASVAQFFGYALHLALPGVQTVSHTADTFIDTLIDVDQHATLVVYSFARKARRTLQMVDFAKQEGARVVAITDSPLRPPGSTADATLLVATQSPAYIQSLAAAFSVSVALLAAITARSHEVALQRVQKAERALVACDVFSTEL